MGPQPKSENNGLWEDSDDIYRFLTSIPGDYKLVHFGGPDQLQSIHKAKRNKMPMFRKQPAQLLSHDHLHLKLGYLDKQARKSHRNWKRRFLVVNLKYRVVSYYNTEKDYNNHKKPKGSFELPNVKDTFVGPSTSSRPNSFEIYSIKAGKGKKETLLVLAAETEDLMVQWVQMLEEICQGNSHDNDHAGGSGVSLPGPPTLPGPPGESSGSNGGGSGRGSMGSSAVQKIHASNNRQAIMVKLNVFFF